MKNILVPIDFSTSSRNASEYAILLAKVLHADVHLLHVYMEPLPVGNVPDYQANTVAVLRTENAARVDKEIAFLRKKYGVTVKGHTATGFRGNAINHAAAEINAELVVMGVKPARKNRILGSTTLKMIRKSTRPLLLIPEKALFQPLKNMVLAIDFTEMIGSAGMEAFFTLARQFNASVSVLHVQKTGEDLRASETAEKLQMGRVLSRTHFHYDTVGANDVDEGILNYLDSHPADLLVMIAHHHSVLERLFTPVHTGALSSEIKLPLLVLKMQDLFE